MPGKSKIAAVEIIGGCFDVVPPNILKVTSALPLRSIIFIFSILIFSVDSSIICKGQSETQLPASDTSLTVEEINFGLLTAAIEGDTLSVLQWIEKGANVNCRSVNEGVTPLMYAAHNGHLETVRLLLHHGAEVNALPQNRVSALMGAVIAGHVFIADTLILNGADINSRNRDGVTPLMIAAAYNDSVMADMLLFYHADMEMKDSHGNTALHYSVYYGSVGVAELLIQKQANINVSDYNGFTPLMIAAQKGDNYLANLLILEGAKIDLTNKDHLTALSLSIVNNHYETARLLISNGANVNHKISGTSSQYSLAMQFADQNMLQLLKISGANNTLIPVFDRVIVTLDINFSPDDFMTGGTIGLSGSGLGIGLQAGYMTRLWVESELYKVNSTAYYQFWESRSVIHIGFRKSFNLIKKTLNEKSGVFIGADGGYTYGNYRGSDKKPDDAFLLVPEVGAFWNSRSFDVKLNYEYMNFKNTSVSPHRINIALGFNINLYKYNIRLKQEPLW